MTEERPNSGFWCKQCHEHYSEEEKAAECCQLPFTIPADCDCYKCEGDRFDYDEKYGRILMNDMQYHTFMQECGTCGGRKTEYVDLGTKGRYVCGECGL